MNGYRPAWMVFLLLLATTLALVAIMIVAGNSLALAQRGGAPGPVPGSPPPGAPLPQPAPRPGLIHI